MPREALISPLTLYNLDNTIFDGIVLPDYHFPRSIEYDDLFLKEGWTLDKETLIDNILLETAELSVLYTDPDFFKFAVSRWAHKEFPVWKALYETIFYKYNPIWNKDGSVKETERQVRDLLVNNTRTKTMNNAVVDNTTENISDTDNTDESVNRNLVNNNVKTENENIENSKTGSNSTTETEVTNGTEYSGSDSTNKVSAYDNMLGFDNSTKNENTANKSTGENKVNVGTANNNESGESNTNRNGVETGNTSENVITDNDRNYNRDRSTLNNIINNGSESETTDNTDSGSIDVDTTKHEFGNIGLTTTQSMIESERNLVKFNIYDLIIDSFKARFCLLVY